MSFSCGWRSAVSAFLVGGLAMLVSEQVGAQDGKQGDFRWMHGANYAASYAATDVEMWLRYDHAVIDRELGYAQKMGLNCVRVFLQSLVYHHEPQAFLARFEGFLATADKHGLKVMPILFDSCFGVAPSLESRHIWVANPGPDRMGKEWWPESDAYATAVVSAHVGDQRIALWDVMNEPTATHLAGTPEGKAQIDAFVAHYCALVKKLDFPNQSSTWVIGPSRTASNRPIVFIDPHWPAEGQTSWWEFHVHTGRLQAGGFALPGLPMVGLGYTDGAAWAATAGGADSADVFELKTNPQNPDQYWYDGQWRDMVVRDVVIRVKTAAGKIEDRCFRMRESVHGPIILEQDGRVLAGAVCGARDTTRLEQWLAMNRSQSARELRDALRMDQAPWLNITYGTRDRHFGYIQSGACPLRGDGPYNMLGLDDGTRSAANWQGRIPFDELPQVHDPASGWLQSCNTAANYVTEGHTLRAEDFPPGVVCGHYAPDGKTWRGRGRRCFEVMPTLKNVTLEQARAFALDTYAPAGPIWVPPLGAAYDAKKGQVPDADLSLKQMADAVREWDFHVRQDSVGATAFRFWRVEYGKLHPEAFGENEAYGAPTTEAEQLDAVKALRSAADDLKKTFGSPLVPWGQVLRLRRGDLDLPLDGDVGFFGGVECLRATGTQNKDKTGRFVFDGGQVIPTVVALTDPIQAWSIVPYGQSRRPESRHYADQAHLYSAGRMRPAWHTWSQLRDHVESVKVVEYEPKKTGP